MLCKIGTYILKFLNNFNKKMFVFNHLLFIEFQYYKRSGETYYNRNLYNVFFICPEDFESKLCG